MKRVQWTIADYNRWFIQYIMVHVVSSKLWLYLDEWTGWLVQVALWVGGQGAGEEGRAQVYRYAGKPGKDIKASFGCPFIGYFECGNMKRSLGKADGWHSNVTLNCLSRQIMDAILWSWTNSMQMFLPLSAFRDKTALDQQQLASSPRVVLGEILSLDASAMIRRSSISLFSSSILSVRQSPLRLMIFCGRSRNGHFMCDFTLGYVNHISLPNKMQFHTTEAKQYSIIDIYFGGIAYADLN